MTIAFARARNTISLSLSLCCVSISSTLRSSLSLHCCVHPFTPEDLTPARVFTSCVSSPDATRIPTIGAHKHSAGKAARLAAEPAHPHQRALRDADLGALPKAKVKVNGGTNVKVTVMSGGRERGELGWQKQRGSRHVSMQTGLRTAVCGLRRGLPATACDATATATASLDVAARTPDAGLTSGRDIRTHALRARRHLARWNTQSSWRQVRGSYATRRSRGDRAPRVRDPHHCRACGTGTRAPRYAPTRRGNPSGSTF
jgi:hypothetical protein